jgi:hypothetical protein
MKLICIYSTLLFLVCCKNPQKQVEQSFTKESELINKKDDLKAGKSFFNFDSIEYYNIDIDENSAMDLSELQDKSELDKLRYDLIIGEAPESIGNLNFINNLVKIGFKKSEIKSDDFKNISQLFSEKPEREGIYFACIPTFRDILIFKKNKKVVGIAKICFDCNQNQIIGSESNIDNFGQGDDYDKLNVILSKYKK